MNSLHELFIEMLKGLYDAELQLVEALPKMADMATNPKLREALELHLEETESQAERLEEVQDELEEELEGKSDKVLKTMIEESERLLQKIEDADVRDAAIIAEAQKVEHHEIVGYGTVIEFSKLMKHDSVTRLLKETLGEEEAADKKLSSLAEKEINKQANGGVGM